MTTKRDTNKCVNEFKIFYDLLMKQAPPSYKAWLFPCRPNDKNPDWKAILKIDATNKKGSWHHKSAQLSKEQCIEHIKAGGNIGLSARKDDALIIGDIDDKEYLNQLPKDTLTTTSRKRIGAHFFGWDKDGTAKINLPTSYGEMRSDNEYVLIPGSYAPFDLTKKKDKKVYDKLPGTAKNDPLFCYYTIRDIQQPRPLSFDDLPQFFKDKEKENVEAETEIKQREEFKQEKRKPGKYDELFKLKVSDITGLIPASKRVSHPLHDSDTDSNFSLSKDGTLGHCWRHLVSLNAVQYLCVEAGYKPCEDAGTPHKGRGLSKIQGDKKALEVAYKLAIEKGLIKEFKSAYDLATEKGLVQKDGFIKWTEDAIKLRENEKEQRGETGGFIFDESKITKTINAPIGIINLKNKDHYYFGVAIPKEEEKQIKIKKATFYKTIQTPKLIIVLDNNSWFEVTDKKEEEYNIKFSDTPPLNQQRWSLKRIKNFIDGKTTPIKINKLYSDIKKQYIKYNYFQEEEWYDVNTLWDMGTYFKPLFDIFPLYNHNGMQGTAKTKTMTTSQLITFNASPIFINPTPSSFFRMAESLRPTFYLDEMEKMVKGWQKGVKEVDDIVQFINSSWSKGGVVPRVERNEQTGKWELRFFKASSPIRLASIKGIEALPSTQDRAITQTHIKPPKEDNRGDLWVEDNNEFKDIRNDCYVFALEYWKDIKNNYQEMKRDFKLANRDWQNWRPLLAIAKLISDDLYNKIGSFAEIQTAIKETSILDEDSWEFKILVAMWEVINLEEENTKIDLKVAGIIENYQIKSEKEKKPSNDFIGRFLNRYGFKKFRKRTGKGVYYRLSQKDILFILETQNIVTLVTQATLKNQIIGVEDVK